MSGATNPNVWSFSLFADQDINDFQNGIHCRLYEKFGNHCIEVDGTKGIYFSVWAPHASVVSVIGNFNHWDAKRNNLVRNHRR